jgi:RNA polymerase sigma factor (sigma-70 family)
MEEDPAVLERFSQNLVNLRPALLSLLVARIGGDLGSAEDCFQEVAVVLWKKHDPDWNGEDFRRFAYRCAIVESRAFHRKSRRIGKRIVSLAPEILESLGQEVVERDTGDSEAHHRRAEALRLCMDGLDAPQRELLDARYKMSDSAHSIAELAKRQGKNVDALYKRLERLRTALHRCILKRLSQPAS